MSDILGIRPFVPAKDFDRSTGFYEKLGFCLFYKDSSIALLRLGEFAFLLQNFFVEAFAANCAVQLLVRDANRAWASLNVQEAAERFGTKDPIPPAMQHWGRKVGFIFDPSGVLWHVTEAPS